MIRFRNVSKAFGAKRVLEGFTLDIPDGQTTVLLGYSGTGKSVALKHIVGLLEPDSGEVEVDGKVVADLSRDELMAMRASIGYVFQFAALFDSMSVFDNVALGLRQQGRPEDEVGRRVETSLDRVGLKDAMVRLPSELSGGMRKRVGIARAIALEPRYILYDEPTTGLDPVTAAVIDELMVRTKRDLGVTGVVVTHDMRRAFAVADRIAMLYEGRVHAVGTVDEIRQTEDPLVRQFIEGRP
ncbi:MAG: ABC transporter ATP-binding protein [Gemmatimonadetes bacterium]|nr:ABC transporter ATP-binding protein [Gemmatimonadota bacterium]